LAGAEPSPRSGSPEAAVLAEADRWRQLLFIALTTVLAMSTWFSASAVAPALERSWGISPGDASGLTTAVQLGFVVGSIGSALLNLPDVLSMRRLIAGSALLAGLSTAAFAIFAHSLGTALPLRFVTGLALAGVYPPGMKLMASWFRSGRGLAIGVLVGALTLGSGAPQLVGPAVSDSTPVLWAAAIAAVAASALALGAVRDGPYLQPSPALDPAYLFRMLRDRRQRLVNLGYYGHMWELYAWWTWLPAWLVAAFAGGIGGSGARVMAGPTAFAAIACAGILGSVGAGLLADRVGRSPVTIGAMAVSGAACLLSPLVFGFPAAAIISFVLIWGAAAIADSAQFSAALTEAADPRYMGTALTLQTAIGFLLTILSIRLVPLLAQAGGWRFAFVFLAAGPLAGVAAMWRARRS